jgi:hypothetical protein
MLSAAIPIMIRFERCRDVKLSGLTLIDPAMFTTFFARCTDIQIERVTVRSRTSAAFGNAFVLAGSRRVSIKDCDADCKDDCIALHDLSPRLAERGHRDQRLPPDHQLVRHPHRVPSPLGRRDA